MQLIQLKKLNIQTCFFQFLWFFRWKCWFKSQIISRIHLSLSNAYKLISFDRNINGNRDVKFFDWDYWSLHWRKKFTLVRTHKIPILVIFLVYYWSLVLPLFKTIFCQKDYGLLVKNISYYCSVFLISWKHVVSSKIG